MMSFNSDSLFGFCWDDLSISGGRVLQSPTTAVLGL